MNTGEISREKKACTGRYTIHIDLIAVTFSMSGPLYVDVYVKYDFNLDEMYQNEITCY